LPIIAVKDDGRGIDAERVAAGAVARGIISPQEVMRMSHAEKLRLIFADGLSTAEETTNISGRGVGMSAVLEVVEACGGTILIDTVLGKGTCFTLQLPKPS
jgi:two-component system, chemotaxis family, sensor kinase CheA